MKRITAFLLSFAMMFTLFAGNIKILAIEDETVYTDEISAYFDITDSVSDTDKVCININKVDNKTISKLDSKEVIVTFVDSNNANYEIAFNAYDNGDFVSLIKTGVNLPTSGPYTINSIAFSDKSYSKEVINKNESLYLNYTKNDNALYIEKIEMDSSNLSTYSTNGTFSLVVSFDKDISSGLSFDSTLKSDKNDSNQIHSTYNVISNKEVRFSFAIDVSTMLSTSYSFSNITIYSQGQSTCFDINFNYDLFDKFGVTGSLFNIEGGINDFSGPILENVETNFTSGETISGEKTIIYTVTLSNDDDIDLSESKVEFSVYNDLSDSLPEYNNYLYLQPLGNHKYKIEINLDSNSLSGWYKLSGATLTDNYGNMDMQDNKFDGLYFYVDTKVEYFMTPILKSFERKSAGFVVNERDSVIYEATIDGEPLSTSLHINNIILYGVKVDDGKYQYTISKSDLEDLHEGNYNIDYLYINNGPIELNTLFNEKYGFTYSLSSTALTNITLPIKTEVKPGQSLSFIANFTSPDVAYFRIRFKHDTSDRYIDFSTNDALVSQIQIENSILSTDLNGKYNFESIDYNTADGTFYSIDKNNFLANELNLTDFGFTITGANDDAIPPEIIKFEFDDSQNTVFTSPGFIEFYLEFSEPIDTSKTMINFTSGENFNSLYSNIYEDDSSKNRYLVRTEISSASMDGLYQIHSINACDMANNSKRFDEFSLPILTQISLSVNLGNTPETNIEPKIVDIERIEGEEQYNAPGKLVLQVKFDKPVNNVDPMQLKNKRYSNLYDSKISFSSQSTKIDDYTWQFTFNLDENHIRGVYSVTQIYGRYNSDKYFTISLTDDNRNLFKKTEILLNIGEDKLDVTRPKILSIIPSDTNKDEYTSSGSASFIVKTNKEMQDLAVVFKLSGTSIYKNLQFSLLFPVQNENGKIEKIADKEYKVTLGINKDMVNGTYILSDMRLIDNSQSTSYSVFDREGYSYLSNIQYNVACGSEDRMGPKILKVYPHEDNKDIYLPSDSNREYKFYIETDESAYGIANFDQNYWQSNSNVFSISNTLSVATVNIDSSFSSNGQIEKRDFNSLTLYDKYGNKTEITRGNADQYDLDKLSFSVQRKNAVTKPVIKNIEFISDSTEMKNTDEYQINVTTDRKLDDIGATLHKTSNLQARGMMGGGTIVNNDYIRSYYELVSEDTENNSFVYALFLPVNEDTNNGIYEIVNINITYNGVTFSAGPYFADYREEWSKFGLDNFNLIVNLEENESLFIRNFKNIIPSKTNNSIFTSEGYLSFALNFSNNKALSISDGYIELEKDSKIYIANLESDGEGFECAGPICEVSYDVRFKIDDKFTDGTYKLKTMHLITSNMKEIVFSASDTPEQWVKFGLDKVGFEAKNIEPSEDEPLKINTIVADDSNQAVYNKPGEVKYTVTTNKKISDASMNVIPALNSIYFNMPKAKVNKIYDTKYEIIYQVDKTWENTTYVPNSIQVTGDNGEKATKYLNSKVQGFEVKCGIKPEGNLILLVDYQISGKEFSVKDGGTYEATYTFNKPVYFSKAYFMNTEDIYSENIILPEILRISETTYKVSMKIDNSIDAGSYTLYALVTDGYNYSWIENGNNKKLSVTNSEETGKDIVKTSLFTAQSDKALQINEWTNEPIKVAVNNNEKETVLVSEDGNSWTEYDPEQEQNESKTLYFKSINSEGQESAVKVVNVKVDQTLPKCLITTPSLKYRMRSFTTGYNIDITADDGLSGVKTVQYALLANNASLKEDDWKVGGKVIVPANFTGTIYARSVDNAGNVSNVESQKLVAKASLSYALEANTNATSSDVLKIKNVVIDDSDSIEYVGIRENANVTETDITESYANGYEITKNAVYTITIKTAAGAEESKSIRYSNIGISELRFNLYGNTKNSAFEDSLMVDINLLEDTVSKLEVSYNDMTEDITNSYENGYHITKNGTYTFTLTTGKNKKETRSITYDNLIEYTDEFKMTLSYDSSNYLMSDSVMFFFGKNKPSKVSVIHNGKVEDISSTYMNGYTVTENGTYEFNAETEGGETASSSITYTNIDNQSPLLVLEGDIVTSDLNSDLLKISISEIGISGIDYVTIQKDNENSQLINDYTEGYTISQNGSYTVSVYMKSGVSASKTITYNNIVEKTMLGDVNGDGVVNSADAQLILQHSVGLVTLNTSQISIADVNKDGTINSADAQLILQFSIGIISEL